jgi:hypothetical protein
MCVRGVCVCVCVSLVACMWGFEYCIVFGWMIWLLLLWMLACWARVKLNRLLPLL